MNNDKNRSSFKDRIASALGSIGEWYDFSLYGYFVPIVSKVFFPTSSSSVGFLKAFSVLAVGFVARPIGAILFGHISDKYGRSVCSKITPVLITASTLIISILPSYNSIGIAAPMLLVFMRILQGISIGGEHSNNIVYLCESGKKSRLFFSGSLASCSGSFGILLASLVSAFFYFVLDESSLVEYGWRIAFFSSVFIGMFTIIMRKNMGETISFSKTKEIISNNFNPIYFSFQNQKTDYIKSFGIILLPATSFYYVFVFLPNHLNVSLGIEPSKILGDNSFSLLSRLAIIPLIGLIADKLGGIVIARISSLLFMILSIPILFSFHINQDNIQFCTFLLVLMTTLNAGTTPGILVQLLRPETRSTVLSLSFNIGFGVFGGLTPVLCHFLVENINKMAPAYYLVIASILTFITTMFIKRDKKNECIQ